MAVMRISHPGEHQKVIRTTHFVCSPDPHLAREVEDIIKWGASRRGSENVFCVFAVGKKGLQIFTIGVFVHVGNAASYEPMVGWSDR